MSRKLFIPLAFLPVMAMAHGMVKPLPASRVVFSLSNEAFVTTNSAKVTVGVNATLANQSVASAKAGIIKKLKTLAPKVNWHMTQFNQTTDQSGLERLSIVANARVSQDISVGLNKKVSAFSKSGEKFSVINMSYTPSLQEEQNARARVREKIYHQVGAEIVRLDKTTGQKYHIAAIAFDGQVFSPQPTPLIGTMFVKRAAANNGASVTTGNKITLSAKVELDATA